SQLTSRHIHPRPSHQRAIQRYEANNNKLFPRREAKSFYDFGANDNKEWLVDEIIAHRWINSMDLEFQVCWTLGEATWEPMSSCKDLEALDSYLELWGVGKPRDLPRHR
ncbi:hypothetical protein JB92DRAFT_2744618, partial [Gautieria morchelliformis]